MIKSCSSSVSLIIMARVCSSSTNKRVSFPFAYSGILSVKVLPFPVLLSTETVPLCCSIIVLHNKVLIHILLHYADYRSEPDKTYQTDVLSVGRNTYSFVLYL